jgi:hypothetical protein
MPEALAAHDKASGHLELVPVEVSEPRLFPPASIRQLLHELHAPCFELPVGPLDLLRGTRREENPGCNLRPAGLPAADPDARPLSRAIPLSIVALPAKVDQGESGPRRPQKDEMP